MFSELVIMVDCALISCLFCRLSYSLQHADCAGAVFYSVMKGVIVAAQSTKGNVFVWVLCVYVALKSGILVIEIEIWLLNIKTRSNLSWGSPNGHRKESVSLDLVIT
jgi:hypothetical protein